MIKNFLIENTILKFASLLLAIALWFFVMLSGRSEIILDVPITFSNLNSDLELVDSPQKVSVTIEGQERIIKSFKKNKITAYVNLEKTTAGRSFFTLSKKNFRLSKTLEITSIDPETISLKIETELKKTVPVKPYVVGLPEKGFVIMEINVEPENISIEGPKSVITKIRTVKTEPIDISGINSNLKFKANPNLSNPNIKSNISKVEVNISVNKIE